MANDPIYPQNEVGQMSDFVKQENARRKLGNVTGHPDPFPENETTPAGLSSEDRSGATGNARAMPDSTRPDGPPSIDSIWLKQGAVYLSDGQNFALPEDILQQIVVLCLRGLELATVEKIKSMAVNHGLKITEQPPPAPESVPSKDGSPDETLRRRGRPKK